MNCWRVGDKFRPRSAVAHAGHLHVNDAFVGCADLLVANTPTVQYARGEVVDDNVRLVGELAGQLLG